MVARNSTITAKEYNKKLFEIMKESATGAPHLIHQKIKRLYKLKIEADKVLRVGVAS